MTSSHVIALVFLVLTSTAVLLSHSSPTLNEGRKGGDYTGLQPPELSDTSELTERELTYTGTIGQLSQAEKDAIVNRHREIRKNVSPSAANMPYMYWDDDLAEAAAKWSSACLYQHGWPPLNEGSQFENYGQNVWLTWGSASTHPDLVKATDVFWIEYKNYDFDTDSCSGRCLHYLAIVAARSTHVGVGIAFCPVAEHKSWNSTYHDVWIMTFNYGPFGVMSGYTPYEKGPSCSLCGGGGAQRCFENTCRDCQKDGITSCDCRYTCHNCGTRDDSTCTCTCENGWWGPNCTWKCEQTNVQCGPNYSDSYCLAPYPDWYQGICPIKCNMCKEKTGNEKPCTT